jgi:homoserine kinase
MTAAPPGSLRLRLPATSANLGPCFDAAALALKLYLEVEATPAKEFSIDATGRSPEICGALKNNLLIETYRGILTANGRDILPLAIRMRNDIPLGMGCGSSAATRLAAVALAAHFGDLDWGREDRPDRILFEATLLEGHPDTVAACWLGGFTVASCADGRVYTASVSPPLTWSVLLALPQDPLPTESARALLPDIYSRADVVANIQATALLSAAFALGRGDLLHIAMRDRVHQPYRYEVCPLLPRLLPLAGTHGILGAALSGAGPAVLLILESDSDAKPDVVSEKAKLAVSEAVGEEEVELLRCEIEPITNSARRIS